MKNHWMTSLCVMVTFCFGCTEVGAENAVDDDAAYDEGAASEAELALSLPHFSGIFVDPAGDPIVGATVKINGVASITGADGKYSRHAALSTNGYKISTTVPGYVPFHETVLTGRDNAVHVLQPLEIVEIDPTVTNTIIYSNGLRLTIPLNSLYEPNGTSATTPVNVGFAYIEPNQLPGDFTGTNAAGQTVAVESLGAVFVQATLVDSSVGLQLRVGSSVTAKVPLPASIGTMPTCVGDGSCNLAAWRFDMLGGKWVEKNANRTVNGNFTTITMTRGITGVLADNGGLGLWNIELEKPAPACTIVEFVGIPFDCYRPPGTPSDVMDPGLRLNFELPYASGPFSLVDSQQIDSSQPFVALYNLTPNALQNVGVTFPPGAPGFCSTNLRIDSTGPVAAGYPNYSPSGGMTRLDSGAAWGGAGIPLAMGTTNAITVADVFATPPRDPCSSRVTIMNTTIPQANGSEPTAAENTL